MSADLARASADTEEGIRRAVAEVTSKYDKALTQDHDKTQKIHNLIKRLRKFKSEYQQMKAKYEKAVTSLHHQTEVCFFFVDFEIL